MDSPLKYFLPAYLVTYFFAAFFWRFYVVWKKTGVNPLIFKGSDNAHDYIGRVFKLLFAAVVAAAAVHSLSERLYEYLTPISWLERPWLRWSGVVLLLISLASSLLPGRRNFFRPLSISLKTTVVMNIASRCNSS